MPAAEILATLAAGGFFLTGLLTGVWKYLQIHQSERGEAHPYVNIAHRTALLYSFACLLLVHFTRLSQLDGTLELLAVAAQVLFFALAVLSYVLHGWLGDTDNQLRRPFVLSRWHLPGAVMGGFMTLLIVAEIGGFLVLFTGVILAL